MAKIKRKVEMILPELIEWGFKQKELLPFFYGSREGSFVQFTPDGWVNITGIESTDTFTVEIEEEITEETAIPRLLEVRNAIPSKEEGWQDLKILKSYMYGNHTIAEVKNEYSVAFYILKDDMTMTLIWKDNELVD